MSCACPPACEPICFTSPPNFGLEFPSLVGPMGPPGGAGTYVNSLAELRLLDPTVFVAGYQANVGGHTTALDGGGGLFAYDPTSVSVDNNGTIVEPTVGPGAWFRVYVDSISVKFFGARGNGVANDTTAIQATIDFAATIGGKVYLPAGTYNVTVISLVGKEDIAIEFDGNALLIGISVGGTSIVNANSGLVTSTRRNRIVGMKIQKAVAASYQSGLEMSGCTDWLLENLNINGIFTIATLRINYTWDCTFIRTELQQKGAFPGLVCLSDNVNANVWLGGRIFGDGVGTVGVICAGFSNSFNTVDISGWATRSMDVSASAGLGIINCYFESSPIFIEAGSSAGNCRGLTITGGYMTLNAAGYGIRIGMAGAASHEGINIMGIKVTGANAGETWLAYNPALVYDLNYFGQQFATVSTHVTGSSIPIQSNDNQFGAIRQTAAGLLGYNTIPLVFPHDFLIGAAGANQGLARRRAAQTGKFVDVATPNFAGATPTALCTAGRGAGMFIVGVRFSATDFRSAAFVVNIEDDGTTVNQSTPFGAAGAGALGAVTFDVSAGNLRVAEATGSGNTICCGWFQYTNL